MKFLVTGAAGFIGSHLCEQLLTLKHEILGVDILHSFYSPLIKEENLKILHQFEKFQFENLNIINQDTWNILPPPDLFDGVFHIAATAGVRASLQKPREFIQANITASVNLLEWAKISSALPLIIASSSSVYGNQKILPFAEDSTSTNEPISPYAASKRACELFGYTYHSLYRLNIAFLRFFTVYGPRGRPDMSPLRFLVQIMNNIPITIFGNGQASRDFTYIADIVNGIIKTFEKSTGYQIFNIGAGYPHSVMELIHQIEKAAGKKTEIRFIGSKAGDVDLTYADVSKSQKILGFQSKISLAEGIQKMTQWYYSLSSEHRALLLTEVKKY